MICYRQRAEDSLFFPFFFFLTGTVIVNVLLQIGNSVFFFAIFQFFLHLEVCCFPSDCWAFLFDVRRVYCCSVMSGVG